MRLTANEVGPLKGLGGSNPLVSAKKRPQLIELRGAFLFRFTNYLPGFTGATGLVGLTGFTGAAGFTGFTGPAPRAVIAAV